MKGVMNMGNETITCTICPIGCSIEVSEDKSSASGYLVKGNSCRRGIGYAIAEVTNPTRILTSTVKLEGTSLKRLPVRTDRPIPKNLVFACMKEINFVEIDAPVELGEIIIENILSTGANVISSRTV
jgi:CxxC motif-containing protein